MKHLIPAISAAVAGATAMYFFDPDQGKRRRALVRDKVVSASSHTSGVTRAQGRRLANRVKGLGARFASHLPSRGAPDSPEVLHDRVRSHLGRAVSHPKAVHVDVLEDGAVRLTGHVLQEELDGLIDAVENVPGVARVDNAMMVHESAANIPELQGGSRRRSRDGGRSRFWRVLAVAAPVAIMAATLRRPSRAAYRHGMLKRLASDREALPPLLARPRRRRYFSAFRVS